HAQCVAFERIVDLAALDVWTGTDLQRFLDEARSSLSPESVLAAEAGIASVSAPGGIAGPARCIVWWNFSRASAPGYTRFPFTRAEHEQLVRCGVELSAPPERAVREARRWRRPLDQATEALLLVSPRADERGDESHPHPLWDEIEARIDPDAANQSVFVTGHLYAMPRAALEDKPLRPAPAPLRAWNVNPALLEIPDRASHAAVEDLLRCPMRWALGRLGKLLRADEIDVEISNRVLGRLAHALLESVLPAAKGDPTRARQLGVVPSAVELL
ncbi:MAG: PD-(D/E)XK nuclease family protein, partial [Proteobacteria bacterium]|nr:PD-(D/E)XK nuclease family protein [Pseudomonadota bacterium]